MNKFKVALLSINAKYVHSSLSVWCLDEGVKQFSRRNHDVEIIESVIKQSNDEIAALITECSPDVVGISTYIWNARKLPDLLNILKENLPDAIFVLGGPEASHNADYWLTQGADYVLGGEGERSFPALLDILADHNYDGLDTVPGLLFNSYGELPPSASVIENHLDTSPSKREANLSPSPPKIYSRGRGMSAKLTGGVNDLIDPYSNEYLETLKGRIAYIETSRGCPFGCAYCLSGGSGVRFSSPNTAKEQIFKLSKSGAKTIKFVDRTFNCNLGHAQEIFEYVIGLDTNCCFHFEVAADLFDGHTLSLLRTAPPGRIQLEAGLQSFHEPTLRAVSRKTNQNRAESNIKTILSGRNIHLHVDLIAGLPLETFSDFKDSFDRAYALGAHTLQLGFLKLLHGSRLRTQAEDLGIKYRNDPPYEIISSPWLSDDELKILKKAENALQHTYNKGRFLSAVRYILSASNLRPFDFYNKLGEDVPNHAMPLEIYAEKIYDFCSRLPNVIEAELRDSMICDILGMTKGKNMPASIKSHGDKRRQTAKIAERRLGRVIDYDEAAVLSSGNGVFADSMSRDPVTGLYKLHFCKLDG